jgi:PH (Pleckstrin Homology) domain-containing protein
MQTFPIAPASFRALWMFLPILAIPIVILSVVLIGLISGMKGTRFEISSEGLRLKGDFYGRTISLPDVRGGAALRIDISTGSDRQPVRKTFGTGLPGYRAGWYRLANGEKALVYITDPSKAVYVPTRQDFSIIVSPNDPDGFLSAIRSAAPLR